MTTYTILYKKEFFYFDPEKIFTEGKRRVANPRSNTSLRIKIPEEKNKDEYNYTLYSNYDLEIFPMNDIADVFCNIKTIMTWKFKIDNQEEFASLPFGESLLHHILNQIHFAATLLRQNFRMDFATIADLLRPAPNPYLIYEKIKKDMPYLANLNLDKEKYPFIFSYWY